ncbi:MAG TPA: peptidase S55 SpoIVB, partial [Candidatus Latescibacteria bacterium]|nr:peptidase S55 SpoIVB [Candidatus Latescibacterota bacterium]
MNSGLPKRIRFTLMLPVVLILSAPVQSASLLDVSELRRGMQGVGRTVFRGTRIDTFQVEILGVLKNAFGPKTNIILAMLSGDPLETTGGIAGMSGSPVYVDGRLIGAVAYGWAFSIEPIMGITPIGEMLEILERPD